MQKFEIYGWKKTGIFLVFSFTSMTIVAMGRIISNEFPIVSDKMMTVFDPKKELELGSSWNEMIPGSLLITPDGEGILIGERGRVRYACITKEENVFPETIIEHPWVKHSPMIKVAQKNDKSLLVVSAGNYKNAYNKYVAECIVFCNGSVRPKKFNWPIQAISLDSCGKLLAIAGSDIVTVMDLETDKTCDVLLKGCIADKNNWVIDMVMNAQGDFIIAAASLGSIQLMGLYQKDNGDLDLSTLTHVTHSDVLEKIYYPNAQELLYIDRDGKVKIIAMAEVVNSQDNIVPTVFAYSSSYDRAIADSSDCIATAHWSNNRNVKKDNQHKIKVFRRSVECTEKFTLEVPVQKQYPYITDLRQRSFGEGHLLQVALRGKRVAALTTDGKLYFWSLPEKNRICNEIEKKDQEELYTKLTGIEIASQAREKDFAPKARRYSTDRVRKRGSGEADAGEKFKKTSPRFIQLLTKSNPHLSRESGSVSSSRENSPTQSPGKIDNRIDNRDNRTEKSECMFSSDGKNIIIKSHGDVKVLRNNWEDKI